MFTIGTAGHVDHGKSALVKALTGMDPDRLPEEKARGMTLDLGFAWLVLPSGREVSIVDVPGHERFISNMLAGVGGIDLALLVVAADEGIMPQTREHLAILDLLGMQGGVVAITKKDLVEGEWLSLVRDEVEKLLRGTGLEKAPICEVSAFTGEGIPGFIVTLDSLLDSVPPKKDIGRPRLPIDRVFSLSGFGTVVTGTLRDGPLSLGGEVEVVPGGLTGRIRGLQSHKKKLETAYPGSRVGVNLSGLFREALERGQMVAYPGELQATQALDVHLRLLPSAPPLIHNSVHRFFSGTAEVEARVLLLDKKRLEPGGEGWARLRLGKEVAVVRGDRFILRSPQATLGGGEVLDPFPQAHRRARFSPKRLALLREGTAEKVVGVLVEDRGVAEVGEIALAGHLSLEESRKAAERLIGEGAAVRLGGDALAGSTFWRSVTGKVLSLLEEYYRRFPLRRGPSQEEVRSRLDLPSRFYSQIISALEVHRFVIAEGSTLRLPGHLPRPSAEQEKAIEAFFAALEASPFSPPELAALDSEALSWLVAEGKMVKLAEGIYLPSSTYREAVQRVVEYVKTKGSVTVAQVRDLLGTSRKYALALLEHLDREKITLRRGDERILLQG